jgi:predicted MFS family arabinose efflux permease
MFLLSRWSGGLVARYGSNAPLIVGPLIVAVGFVLFAIPSANANYWRSFFPAFLVLGFGMAISVAPLTTVVMSSVGESRTGTASGINNAVARVAGVLSVAVLGILMAATFAHSLRASIATLHLDSAVVQYLESNVGRLGAQQAPAGLGPEKADAVHDAVTHAFVFGFRIIMLICASLALASAIVAWRMIPARGA